MSITARLSAVGIVRNLSLFIGGALLIFLALDTLAKPGVSDKEWFLLGAVRWMPLQEMPLEALLLVCFLATIAPAAFVFMGMVQRRLERGLVGTGTDGELINLTPEAVEAAVKRDVRGGVADIVKIAACTASQGRRGARIRLSVVVSDRSTVPVVRRRTTEVVKETLERVIGYSDTAEVFVKVVGLAGNGRVRPARSAKTNGAA